jgi:hypothetical protein
MIKGLREDLSPSIAARARMFTTAQVHHQLLLQQAHGKLCGEVTVTSYNDPDVRTDFPAQTGASASLFCDSAVSRTFVNNANDRETVRWFARI